MRLALPIASQFTDPQLYQTPAVFSGALSQGDLIIGGHNYKAHFGTLHQLNVGDKIALMDGTGTRYYYTLAQTEELAGTELEQLLAGEWDMTLFTCIYGNNTLRTVLRFVVST